MSLKLKEVSKGGIPTHVRLRKNDLLINFGDDLNRAIDRLESQRTEIEAALAAVKSGDTSAAQEHLDRATSAIDA
jgi:hypothetical protein